MDHIEQLAFAPLFADEVADGSGLKVGDDHLGRVVGKDEAAIELSTGKSFLSRMAMRTSGVTRFATRVNAGPPRERPAPQ